MKRYQEVLALAAAAMGMVAGLAAPAHAVPKRRTIYLNKGGGVFLPGALNDSSANTSGLVQAGMVSQAVIPPAPLSPTQWTELVTCVQNHYAPFSVVITDVDPGTEDHIEVVIGGTPELVNPMLPDYYGDSPLHNCNNGIPLDRAVVFVFADKLLTDLGATDAPKRMCEYAALEAARALTLDHEYDCASLMTVRTDCVASDARSFLNAASVCGEDGAEVCRCGMNNQNATDKLLDVLGAFDDVAPVVSIMSPGAGATVPVGFTVLAEATDETQMVNVELWIDGAFISVDNFGPSWELTTPGDLALGAHTLEVRAHDNGGNQATATIDVTVEAGCTGDGECEVYESCVGGACLGDFGAPCETSDHCASGLCAQGGDGFICTAVCEGAGAVDCPAGTSCQTVPGGGLDKCVPGGGGGGGCLSVAGGHGATGRSLAPIMALLTALAAALGPMGFGRRRR